MKMHFDFVGFSFEKIKPARTEEVILDSGKVVEGNFKEYKESAAIEKISLELEYTVEEFVELMTANKELMPVMLDFLRKMK